MKPIEPPPTLPVYILAGLSSTGTITYYATGSGYFLTLEDAQQEQMLKALTNIKTQVFCLEFPRP